MGFLKYILLNKVYIQHLSKFKLFNFNNLFSFYINIYNSFLKLLIILFNFFNLILKLNNI